MRLQNLFISSSDQKGMDTMKKRILSALILMVLLVVSAGFANQICKAKFIGDSTSIINGFYEEKKNSLDVIFIGSSNCFCTVDPVLLYDKYGITAYDFASSSQPMNISALYVKEALKTQKPKVIALEANMLVGNGPAAATETALRWGYTDIPFSINKLKCIYQSVGKIDKNFVSYVFPMLLYHNRWSELTKLDYTYFKENKWNPDKGYLMSYAVTETPIDFSEYELDGEAYIDEKNLACLDEIAELCQKNGIELLLFKAPRQEWYSFHTKKVEELAAERNIPYIDYNALTDELSLDGALDFRDVEHVNKQGAEKVTLHLGDYLTKNYQLTDHRAEQDNDSFEKALVYRERKTQNNLPQITDMAEYLSYIGTLKEVTIVMAAEGKCSQPEEKTMQLLYAYHFQKPNLKKGALRVFESGTSIFKAEGKKEYVSSIPVKDKEIVLIKQKGTTQIQVEGEDYHKVDNGINLLVFDHVTGEILDAVGFDALNDFAAIR